MKKIFLLLYGFMVSGLIHAQSDTTQKSLDHYFNIQANQLLRQLVNFGGSSQNVVNPFLINYAFNASQNGIGMNVGWGFEVDNFETGDEFNERETKIREFFFRAGLDKKYTLNDKWLMGWGVDILREDVKNHTVNTFDGGGVEQTVETTNTSKGWGFGPRMFLAYRLNDYMLLSTEASYYYKHTTIVSRIEQGSTDEEEESTNNSLNLLLPAVIYLTFTF